MAPHKGSRGHKLMRPAEAQGSWSGRVGGRRAWDYSGVTGHLLMEAMALYCPHATCNTWADSCLPTT